MGVLEILCQSFNLYGKGIDELDSARLRAVGRAKNDNKNVSVARIKSPEGWAEPGQNPEIEEISVVISGTLKVELERGSLEAGAGQAIVAKPDSL